ncbi:alpha/beta fold hydrolase [Streptosporangium jomthongense]|uniref:Alpha/beta fold hydrolase n=1 Tax=Streptosporangium jomthongense TaxID=1193683 RepID=A0ABV8EX78_9ACTN
MDGGTRAGIGRFRDGRAERRFRAAYEVAMGLWPPHEVFDVETSFGTTRVYRCGPRDGEPVVLLHGHGANASMWYLQAAGVGCHRPVYAVETIDDPGGGVQRRVVTGSGDSAAWLEEVLAGLGLERVHLVGLSYGGWLALNQAVYGARRLASVTLLDPGGLARVPLRFMVTLLVTLLAMAAPPSWRRALYRVVAEWALVGRPEIMAPVVAGARGFRPDRSPARRFGDEELARVAVPVQLIVGGRSSLVRPAEVVERARRLLPVVHAEVVPGVGHAVALEAPELVNDRLVAFADRCRGGGGRSPGPDA